MPDDPLTPVLVSVARVETKLDSYAAELVTIKAAQAATELKVTALMAAEALRTGQAQGRNATWDLIEKMPSIFWALFGMAGIVFALTH